jgi:2-methylisocitrate lyase-like PEP mutase family enzyme
VNVVVSPADKTLTVAELQRAGVKRISLGASLYLHTMTELQRVTSILAGGDLASATTHMGFPAVARLLAPGD